VNKIPLRVVLPAFLIICVITFLLLQYPRKSFDNLLGTNETNITKVFMRNGGNGYGVETNNKDKIKELVNLLNNRHYIKAINQKPRTGYSYFYEFYSGDKMILRITGSGNNVNINGTYYKVDKEISLDLLNNWFNSLSATK